MSFPSSFPNTRKLAFTSYSTKSSSLSEKITSFTLSSSRIMSAMPSSAFFSSSLSVTSSALRSGWRALMLYWERRERPIETADITAAMRNSRALSRRFSSGVG